jgi:hypothetical protein
LHLCSVSSHSWAARFSFLRQRNKDASMICHFLDVSRVALHLIPLSPHIFEQYQIGFD